MRGNRFSSLPVDIARGGGGGAGRRGGGRGEKKINKKEEEEEKEFDSRYNINFYELPHTCAHNLPLDRGSPLACLRLDVERRRDAREIVRQLFSQDRLESREPLERDVKKVGRFLQRW